MAGFVDEAQIHAKGGDGGAGSTSFRREAHVDRGGPDGGDGGDGGDVWLVASINQASLLAFKDHPHRAAGSGGHGSGQKRHGVRGKDLLVPVPLGTVVRERDGSVLCDLTLPGERWLAAAGGKGGRGNARFLSNKRRAPSFSEQGERGEERWLNLDLKLIADVALVGYPNAGKSTLISAVSAARPKIADYPFTTLEPHLGVVRVGGRAASRAGSRSRNRSGIEGATDEVEIVVADVPGLIEGAAEGRGLGHRFLRHVERSRVIVFLLDLASMEGVSAAEQLAVLERELDRYRPELLERPRVVVGSKCDVATERGATAGDGGPGGPIDDVVDIEISAVTGEGVGDLLNRLAPMVVASRDASKESVSSAVLVHRPLPEGIRVERVGERSWELLGRPAERAVALSDLNDSGAASEVTRRLKRLGVDRLLRRVGARDGDEVRVGETSFTWSDDDGPMSRGTNDELRRGVDRRLEKKNAAGRRR
ncbi:MAG: Obg family GTPase CgtA [Acidimicrobiales bacterium]